MAIRYIKTRLRWEYGKYGLSYTPKDVKTESIHGGFPAYSAAKADMGLRISAIAGERNRKRTRKFMQDFIP
jgi:hypothetical protein